MTETEEIRQLYDWKDETTIVPFSGIQMLDFGFNLTASTFRSMRFLERTTRRTAEGDERSLLVLTGDDDEDEKIVGEDQPDDDPYSINASRALEPFIEKWTPVPVLRLRPNRGPNNAEQFDAGPTCWARLLVKELPAPDPKTGHTHRVVLALDTTCEPLEDPLFYQAPATDDGERKFKFVHNVDQMSWFVSRVETDETGNVHDLQLWVDEWIFDQFEAVQKKSRSRPDDDGPERLFEHWARYFAFLNLIAGGVKFPEIRLIDTMSRDPITDRFRYTPIDVDLVLDVGNSNTCGILIETLPNGGAVDLSSSYKLALRDLSNPLYRYSRPFESRVEFSDARFGNGRSSRSRSFFWPSLVRVGPEAMRLTKHDQGTETTSGLSSPKRYLWDDRPMSQDWRFHNFTPSVAEPLPLVARAVQNEMNEAGDVLDQVASDVKNKLRRKNDVSMVGAARPRFSRSSTYGLMLAELFLQAIVQINDPAQRESRPQGAVPRRLRNIVLTLPSATPVQEQAIMRSRAEGALKLVYKVLKWSPSLALNTSVPEIKVDWDEASATQMVYVFSELNHKFGGHINRYFELFGRPRKVKPRHGHPGQEEVKPSLRVGCIDIGGGTTDLMVMTYHAQGEQAVVPNQDFREGFRVAGDDMLREIVTRIILPQVVQDLVQAGLAGAKNIVKTLFAADVGDRDIRISQQRRQYALRVLAPLAVSCLQQSEKLGDGGGISLKVGDLQSQDHSDVEESASFIDYLEQAVHDAGLPGWKLSEVTISLRRQELDTVVRNILQKPIGDLCEIIDQLGCDVVLLSGRPSQLAAIRDIVREAMVVPPSRLVSMHEYEVGEWYPYRDQVTDKIRDPKWAAAVGAMLSLLAQNRLVNFMVYTDNITMASTARFIGQVDNNGAISADRVLFQDVDGGPGSGDHAEIELYSPSFIGFRQLPHERWTTTVIYRVDFANEQAARRTKPFKVTIAREEFDNNPESAAEVLRAEALKEALIVVDAEDGAGGGAKNSDISLKLQTLGVEQDYWLDSGLFRL